MKKMMAALFSVVMIAGCGAQNDHNEARDKQVNVKNSTDRDVGRDEGQEVSRHLESLANGVHGVKDTTAVVLGPYAIVGINVDENLDRAETGSIKYSVAESLEEDPNGARAMVIADPDVAARLREITADIQDGRPVQGIMNELAEITGRLMPEVPADLDGGNPGNSPEEPKQKINRQRGQQLERDQERQSNYYK
ncbi:YhcN/YlaJ family sporulation lipoprotein [Bacillus sp. T33-2]|uniref:YhcN/YlaJ family sporulation lipoprotein n=1 Tax=Bacillus sp. T33-2 TaxID=2054168 RepID=UPI000C78FEE3|nr:YhcN/YlaJ family sporulation lipoprotein [Bacillus sp. T33-2]PLR97426.1 hypothetical protein CVD19_08020 [Bacillus sp. T33-2]